VDSGGSATHHINQIHSVCYTSSVSAIGRPSVTWHTVNSHFLAKALDMPQYNSVLATSQLMDRGLQGNHMNMYPDVGEIFQPYWCGQKNISKTHRVGYKESFSGCCMLFRHGTVCQSTYITQHRHWRCRFFVEDLTLACFAILNMTLFLNSIFIHLTSQAGLRGSSVTYLGHFKNYDWYIESCLVESSRVCHGWWKRN